MVRRSLVYKPYPMSSAIWIHWPSIVTLIQSVVSFPTSCKVFSSPKSCWKLSARQLATGKTKLSKTAAARAHAIEFN